MRIGPLVLLGKAGTRRMREDMRWSETYSAAARRGASGASMKPPDWRRHSAA